MSDFNVSCPECSQLIICNESHRGTQVACPHCSKNLVINSRENKRKLLLHLDASPRVHDAASLSDKAIKRLSTTVKIDLEDAKIFGGIVRSVVLLHDIDNKYYGIVTVQNVKEIKEYWLYVFKDPATEKVIWEIGKEITDMFSLTFSMLISFLLIGWAKAANPDLGFINWQQWAIALSIISCISTLYKLFLYVRYKNCKFKGI